MVGDDDKLGLFLNQVHQFLHLGLCKNHFLGTEGSAFAAQSGAIQLGIDHNHAFGRPIQAVFCPACKQLVNDRIPFEHNCPIGIAGSRAVHRDIGEGCINAFRTGQRTVDRDAHAGRQLFLGTGVDGQHTIDHQIIVGLGNGIPAVDFVTAVEGAQIGVPRHFHHIGTVEDNGQLAHGRFSRRTGEQGGAVDGDCLVMGVVFRLHVSGVTDCTVDH